MSKASTIEMFCDAVRDNLGATVHSSGAHGAVITCADAAQTRAVSFVAGRWFGLTADVRGLDVFVS